MPSVTVIGVHPLKIDEVLVRDLVAREATEGPTDGGAGASNATEAEVRRRLEDVVLVEVAIQGYDRRMYIGDFGQSNNDSIGPDDAVAYSEVFLDSDGKERVADYLDRVRGDEVRVAFYLDEYRQERPILTSYGPVQGPAPSPMPRRLRRIVPYRLDR